MKILQTNCQCKTWKTGSTKTKCVVETERVQIRNDSPSTSTSTSTKRKLDIDDLDEPALTSLYLVNKCNICLHVYADTHILKTISLYTQT